jgi:hypothetical protein
MRKLTVPAAVFGAICASAFTTSAHAWGDEGHKVVCEIAISQVKSSTRAAILELIRADGEFDTFSGLMHLARSSAEASAGALRKPLARYDRPDK